MATLSRWDADRWAAIAARAAGAVRRVLGPQVLGPWGRQGRRQLGAALGRARDGAARLAARSPIVVRTDVQDFYGSVSPRIVLDALRSAASEPEAASAAAMLEGWGSDGYVGLPIGPPASAVVADAVLAPADEALGPLPFLRWVDDYLIAVPSERAAYEALDRLDAALERVGLRRSVPKTLVTSGSGFVWLGTSIGPTTA